MNELCRREAIPVTIGYMELYCESFKASAVSDLSEQPTVSGGNVITNRSKKSTRLVFKGRVYNETVPLQFLFIANTMDNPSGYTIEYRGMTFNNCIIYGFTVEDKGDDFVYVSVTVATPDMITIKK